MGWGWPQWPHDVDRLAALNPEDPQAETLLFFTPALLRHTHTEHMSCCLLRFCCALLWLLAACLQVTGVARSTVAKDYEEMTIEWNNLLGWCCEKAFCNLDQVSSMYEEQINLFYVLIQ